MNKVSERKVVAIIPARGGSKKVPRKNIRLLAGKPLIGWTIETSLKCRQIHRTIVSTDDSKIAEIALEYGAEVPFLRPAALAQDDAPDFPVWQHALRWLAEHEDYHPDVIVWLRPTCPLRRVRDIEAAIDKLTETGADGVRSVSPVEHHPYWMRRIENDRLVLLLEGTDETLYYQRQLLPDVYRLNGAIEVVRADTVIEKGQLFSGDVRAYVMEPEFGLDLDTELDFMLAEAIMKRRAS